MSSVMFAVATPWHGRNQGLAHSLSILDPLVLSWEWGLETGQARGANDAKHALDSRGGCHSSPRAADSPEQGGYNSSLAQGLGEVRHW